MPTLSLHRVGGQSDAIKRPALLKLVTFNEPRSRMRDIGQAESRNLRRQTHRQSNCRDQLYAAVHLMPCTCRHARRVTRAIGRAPSIAHPATPFSGLLLPSSPHNDPTRRLTRAFSNADRFNERDCRNRAALTSRTRRSPALTNLVNVHPHFRRFEI